MGGAALLTKITLLLLLHKMPLCSDDEVLRQNYTNKMKYSPDYTGVPTSQV